MTSEAFDAAMRVWMQRVTDQVQDTPEGHIRALLAAVEPIIRRDERIKCQSNNYEPPWWLR